jgi:pimeloyl-ACP methyl ester carboxylesterase
MFWEDPQVARFFERLAAFSRLILFDKRVRGSRIAWPTWGLETRMDDVRAVLDAVGSTRAALCGYSEGGPMSALFAATYPERSTALIMLGSYARLKPAPHYPWGHPILAHEAWMETCCREWGTPLGLDMRWPTATQDERARKWWARNLRMSAGPAAAIALIRMNYEIDIRHILPVIGVPTLVLHATDDRPSMSEQADFSQRALRARNTSSYQESTTSRGVTQATRFSTRSRSSSRECATGRSRTGCWSGGSSVRPTAGMLR